MRWLEQVRYTQPAQQVTLRDCLNEVEHMSARAGNEYLRRIVAESAWCQRHWPESEPGCANYSKGFRQRSPQSQGKRRIACTSAT